MMKRFLSMITAVLLAILSASAQNGTLDPTNPPEPSAKYRLTVKAQPAEAATTSGSGEYAEGTQVTVKATAKANYVFKHWLQNGTQISQTATSWKLTMPADYVELVAVFEYQEPEFDPTNPAEPQYITPEYALYLVADPVGAGTFNRTSGAKVKEGATVSIKATPTTGYQFTGWYNAEGTQLSTAQTLSYTMPSEATTLTARFTYNPTSPSEPSGNQDNVDNAADAVVLTARSYTRQYGEANPTFGYDVTSGTITSGTPTLSCSATKTSPVGTYDIVIAKGSVSNSSVSLVNGTLTITPAPLTISAGDYTREEGQENPTFTPTFSGFKNGETKSVLTKQPTISTTATKNSPAGTYPVTVSGAEAQNYDISYQQGTLTVTPKSTPGGQTGQNITFADPEVKRICVENWDTDGDGELSMDEAAAVTSIEKVFKDNTLITSFDEFRFFTSVTTLKFEAFYNCENLISISLPNSLKYTNQNVFASCDKLSVIEWPDNDGFSLSVGMFQFCAFTSITLPKNLRSLSGGTFEQCYSLTEILVDSANPNYKSVDGVVFSKDGKTIVAYPNGKTLTEYTIQEGVEEIADEAFAHSEKLQKLTIPTSVKTLGYGCLNGMSNLKSLTISQSVTEIPRYCCAWNYELEEVNIPKNTTKIGMYAFANNKVARIVLPSQLSEIEENAFYDRYGNIKEVVSEIIEPFPIDESVFYTKNDNNFTDATLYVPAGTKAKYQAAEDWKKFKTIIEMEETLAGDVNRDGQVGIGDIVAVTNFMAGSDGDVTLEQADVNGDGDVGIGDIVAITNIMAGNAAARQQ